MPILTAGNLPAKPALSEISGSTHSRSLKGCAVVSPLRSGLKQKAFTLLEVLTVVAILGILAAAAIPNLAPLKTQKLDLAAVLVANAIRFAQEEAIRSGQFQGVSISQVTQVVEVASYDISTAPVSAIATATNPLSKQPYQFDFDILASTKGVSIDNTVDIFEFDDNVDRRSLLFDPNGGTPLWIVSTGPSTHLLVNASVLLGFGDEQREVTIDRLTGRVRIQ